MMSRVLGLLRDQVLAHRFGSGDAMDAFNVAFRIPNLLRDLFAEGAMSAAFVPTFTRALTTGGREHAWRLASLAITALMVVTGAIVLVGIVFATPLTTFLAGDYASVPGKLELTVRLTRTMFPFLAMIAVAVALMGMLNSLGWFFIPALSPAMFNVATIVSVFAIVPVATSLGWDPIVGLAVGTLLGGLGQILLQWPAIHREGYRYRFAFAPRDPALREILALMIPGTVGLAATQINLFVSTILATGEGTGAMSWLNYAFRIMYLPIGLFGVSVASAAMPTLSAQAGRHDHAAMRDTVSKALRMMLMLNVPATFGLIALAEPIVRLIFQRGAFTATDTTAVGAALACYAPGLVGYSAVKVASPTFYALKDSRTPVIVSFATVALNVGMSLALVGVMSYQGLALATAVTAITNACILLWLLSRRIGGLDSRRVAVAFAKTVIVSLVMAGAAWFVHRQVANTFLPGTSTIFRFLQVAAGIGAGVLTLAVSARVLRVEEFDQATARVLGRFTRARS